MVQELDRPQYQEFPETAPTAYPVFYRTYSRRVNGQRETWQQVGDPGPRDHPPIADG